jgi:hypothetical protein
VSGPVAASRLAAGRGRSAWFESISQGKLFSDRSCPRMSTGSRSLPFHQVACVCARPNGVAHPPCANPKVAPRIFPKRTLRSQQGFSYAPDTHSRVPNEISQKLQRISHWRWVHVRIMSVDFFRGETPRQITLTRPPCRVIVRLSILLLADRRPSSNP